VTLVKAATTCLLASALGLSVGVAVGVVAALTQDNTLGWVTVRIVGSACVPQIAGLILLIVDTVKDKNV
jgi:hypothetical protein